MGGANGVDGFWEPRHCVQWTLVLKTLPEHCNVDPVLQREKIVIVIVIITTSLPSLP